MAERGRPRSFDRLIALRRAMEVFWAKDYDGASLSDLTRAMGINSPSLYAAFGSKEALFREAVQLYGTAEGTEIWRAVEDTAGTRDAFERFLRLSAEAFTTPGKPRGCLIALGLLHSTDANAPVRSELRTRRRGNVATLRRRLQRGVDEGEVPTGFDCDAAARFYAAVQQGMSTQARDGASREELLAIGRGAMVAWDAFNPSTTASPRNRKRGVTRVERPRRRH